ncbi:unnamed protein product [Polarella glacialis]|uniref:Uncharacterized protein n=1 Tax=Polarella glacialis TaxID=89957 RepID=A0A813JIV0_POLGL|nr:unnamed protein product [Polarella glacialis]
MALGKRRIRPTRLRSVQLLNVVAALGAACCLASRCSNSTSDAGFVAARRSSGTAGIGGLREISRGSKVRPPHVRQMFGGGRPGGGGGGGGEGGGIDLSTIFFGAIILSFIPGPWQMITGPILSILNAFYMFKFGIFLLGIAAVFGFSWWVDATTAEGQCPNCGTPQRASKSEPFGCEACGEELEFKDDMFVRYVKSGKAPGSPFEQMRDFAKEASKAASKEKETEVSTGTPSSSSIGPSKRKKDVEVVDAEVL